jgi:integrase
MRIGEALGLHLRDLDLKYGVICVRRSAWRGRELTPKTQNAVREIDIDATLVEVLREYIGESKRTLLFEGCNGTPLPDENIRNRVIKPLLA